MPFKVYPGVDASYRIGENWKVYASYNSSLRMPSFTELYYSVGGHKADKHLKPEELRAVEGGVGYSSQTITAKANIFYHHARNMIDWVMDTREAEPVWQSMNHTKVNTLGEELSFSLAVSNWQLAVSSEPIANSQKPKAIIQLSYCHLHQQKQETNYLQSQYSLEYLRHKVTAKIGMLLTKRLNLTVSYRWQDRVGEYTTTEGQIESYHPYSVVDARLGWNAEHYTLYVEGNNLTNHRYVDYGNVPQPGAWMMTGLTLHL